MSLYVVESDTEKAEALHGVAVRDVAVVDLHAANCHCHAFIRNPDFRGPEAAGSAGRVCSWWLDGTPCDAGDHEHPFEEVACKDLRDRLLALRVGRFIADGLPLAK